MIDDVKKLFEERLKIQKDIEQTKMYHAELLLEVKDENKVVDKYSDDFSNSIFSKLKEILEEKRNEALPSLPQLPFVSEPELIIYNNDKTKSNNMYNPYSK